MLFFEEVMANTEKHTKEYLVLKAVELVRKKGYGALGIRSLAEFAKISTQPIYRNFGSLKELNECVLNAINDLYADFLKKEISSGKYPAYKASGIGYVKFAKAEPELFKALFMRSRKNADGRKEDEEFNEIARKISAAYGIPYEKARKFHLIMWLIVHGAATQSATEYLTLSENDVSDILTETFNALFGRNKTEELCAK